MNDPMDPMHVEILLRAQRQTNKKGGRAADHCNDQEKAVSDPFARASIEPCCQPTHIVFNL
jgi:hypothetical protein